MLINYLYPVFIQLLQTDQQSSFENKGRPGWFHIRFDKIVCFF